MPCIVTFIHNPVALAATCRRLNLPAPEAGSAHPDGREVCGWVVRVPGVRCPIICDTLTGLVAYHPVDNAFGPYARIMKFILRFYDVQAQLRRGQCQPAPNPSVARRPRYPLSVTACR